MKPKASDAETQLLLHALLGLELGESATLEQLSTALARAEAKSAAERTPREQDLLAGADRFESYLRSRAHFSTASSRGSAPPLATEPPPDPVRSRARLMSRVAVAISAAILLLVVLTRTRPLVPNVEALPLRPPQDVMAQQSEDWRRVQEAWRQEEYETALAELDRSLRDAPEDPGLLYDRALALLLSGVPEQAVTELRTLVGAGGVVEGEAEWLLVAALDQMGDREAACVVLREIVSGKSARAEEAARRAVACG